MFKRKISRKTFQLFLLSLILITICNESLLFMFKKIEWTKLQCNIIDNCTRIMFVADPQILGETFDTNVYNPLAIYDSDRDIKRNYNRVLNFANPQIICFLGDLFDEGSVATEAEYDRYYNRFKNIFFNDNQIKMVFIPGDNDIGGENNDRITWSKVNRFQTTFKDPKTINFKNRLKIFKADSNYLEIPDKIENPGNETRIILTHMPVLSKYSSLSKKLLENIDPHIIFSAHEHKSMMIESSINLLDTKSYKCFACNGIEILDLTKNNKLFKEIMVPTCSYRMGVKDIGYGLAVIENSKLRYTVYWVPNRFIQLFGYIFYFSICTLIFLIRYVCLRKKK